MTPSNLRPSTERQAHPSVADAGANAWRERIADVQSRDPDALLGAILRFSGLQQRTATDRVERAIQEEYDFLERTATDRAEDRRRAALEQRLSWLIGGTSEEQLSKLDPRADCDQIRHRVASTFRVEGRILETLAINRIAQSNELLVLIRGTRRAEDEPITRFQDTYTLLANFFEWGPTSLRGSTAVERIRTIHGRYSIPNAGMKYVLLTTAFTWLDGADRIGHRPLSKVERLGVFHSLVNLGQAMGIADISHDHDAMYGWYQEFNWSNRSYHPTKADTFRRIVEGSLAPLKAPLLKDGLRLAFAAGMAPEYREAVGIPEPTAQQVRAVQAVCFTLGSFAEAAPAPIHLRSLQNSPAHSTYTRPDELGAPARSPFMPSRQPGAANGGFPENLPPITEGATPAETLRVIPWHEVRRHNTLESPWVVIAGLVYDLSALVEAHPGGRGVLEAAAGHDATEAFAQARHSAFTAVIARNYCIGRVETSEP